MTRGTHVFTYDLAQAVEADWGDSGWHRGTITARRMTAAEKEEYEVEYPDGSVVGLKGWRVELLRPVEGEEPQPSPPKQQGPEELSPIGSDVIDNVKRRPRVVHPVYKPGTQVEVFWAYMNEWYEATIVDGEIAATGTARYTVSYADGSTEGTRDQKEKNIR